MTQEKRIKLAESEGWKHVPPPIGGVSTAEWQRRDGSWSSLGPTYDSYDTILPMLARMTGAEWQVFGENILRSIGHDFDWYEGWDLHPGIIQEILTCPIETLVHRYGVTKGLWAETDKP